MPRTPKPKPPCLLLMVRLAGPFRSRLQFQDSADWHSMSIKLMVIVVPKGILWRTVAAILAGISERRVQ